MPIRAVFFDVGETLVHPHPSFPELFTLVLRDHGQVVDPAASREALHVVFDRFDRAMREGERWTTSPERSRSFWLSVYEELLEAVGLPRSPEVSLRLYGEFTNLSNYRLFPDALPAIEDLRRRGMGVGVISNFEEWLERLLERLGVTALLDVRVISGVEGLEKPDPAIFRLALDRAAVEADEAAYVGDNPVIDIEPAEALGMLGILIDRRGRFPAHAGLRITSLEELPGALQLARIS